jgi:hypothetical protein
MGGLFGAVLSTPVVALIVSCEGSFCADAMLTVAHSVAAINSDCVFIICLLSRFLPSTLMSSPGSMAGSANGQPSNSQFPEWSFGLFRSLFNTHAVAERTARLKKRVKAPFDPQKFAYG